MRNIPADIAATASQICASVGVTDSHARKVFAAAILAERERCADVAKHLNGWGPVGGHRVAEHIAHTILNP